MNLLCKLSSCFQSVFQVTKRGRGPHGQPGVPAQACVAMLPKQEQEASWMELPQAVGVQGKLSAAVVLKQEEGKLDCLK